MRLYKSPHLTTRSSETVKTTLTPSSKIEIETKPQTKIRSSIKTFQAYQKYIRQTNLIRPIRGKELFSRSIRRIVEQIQEKKKELLNFTNIEDAVVIFDSLTFTKVVQLKKKLFDHENRPWTIEFAQEGGLQALLTYLEQVPNRNLSLTDAILVSETLQCLRAMMNIEEIFEHIVDHLKYVDSIVKVLHVQSGEIRTRVFELLIALCVYSADGYELVLKALKNFQTQNKLPDIFAIILEQMRNSFMPKHKWSALALLNTIISSTDSIDKRLLYRNTLHSNGFTGILAESNMREDEDISTQIEIFNDGQKRDHTDYLEHFDHNNQQAIYQAIELQLGTNSEDSGLFVTAMQALYTNVIQAEPTIRTMLIQRVLDSILLVNQKPATKQLYEKETQTDSECVQKASVTVPASILVNSSQSAEEPSKEAPPPPPPPLFGNAFSLPPPPPPPPPMSLSGGGPPPPPPMSMPVGGGPPPLPGLFMPGLQKLSTAGLSVLLDKIPKPKNTMRRLQWKKLTEKILMTSRFWKEVNGDIDQRIDFDHIDITFKAKATKAMKAGANDKSEKKKQESFLSRERVMKIGVFLKRFKCSDVDLFLQPIFDAESNRELEFFRILLTLMPQSDEINSMRNSSPENFDMDEKLAFAMWKIPSCELRIKARIFTADFAETYADFEKKFKKIRTVMNFILNNSSLKHLARTVLSIGDFLNHGSFAGDAFGFRLESINQLTMIRSETNETLLSLLLEICPENFEFVIELKSLLAEGVSFKDTKADYLSWKANVQRDFEQLQLNEDPQLIERYKSFYETSISSLTNNIDPLISECDAKETEILEEFGETDSKDFNYNSCCTIFRQFMDEIEKEQKEREKRALAKKREATRFKTPGATTTSKEINLVDRLLAEIRQGRIDTCVKEDDEVPTTSTEQNKE